MSSSLAVGSISNIRHAHNMNISRPNSLKINEHASQNTNDRMCFTLTQQADMLIRSSPELEKFLTQLNATSPMALTPSSFLNPKFVSQEDEYFANNFTQKLLQLKEKSSAEDNKCATSTTIMDISYSGRAYDQPQYSTASATGPSTMPCGTTVVGPSTMPCVTTVVGPGDNMSCIAYSNAPLDCYSYSEMGDDEEEVEDDAHYRVGSPVSSVHSSSAASVSCSTLSSAAGGVGAGSSASRSNPALHKVKLDRKRARNRDAARKCREKKIRQIKVLEEQKMSLIDSNNSLDRKFKQLQNEVLKLKKFIVQNLKKEQF